MIERPLTIGVLGAANIARLFVAAVRPSAKVRVSAIASRDVARARAFAAETGIDRVHESYDALLADPDVEVVYVPLPNNLHAEWSIRALESGKHVLCEKPLAASSREAAAMFEAARRNDVYLVEGYPYRAQPQTIRLRQLLQEHAIGDIQTIQASFGFPLVATENIRLRPELAGGALMDAGSYPVSLVRMIAGERPARVQALARMGTSGVDRTLVGNIEFANGLLAQIACSFATARHRKGVIVGDAGSITTSYFNDTSSELPPTLEVRRGLGWDAKTEIIETAATSGFLAEAEAMQALVRGGWSRWPGTTAEESIDIALTLEALAASAKHGSAVAIPGR